MAKKKTVTRRAAAAPPDNSGLDRSPTQERTALADDLSLWLKLNLV